MYISLRSARPRRQWICKSCAARLSTAPLHRGLSSLQRTTSRKLPERPARTRFAPSPTGSLHLGSLRTALFNFLLARATGGQFLLRIEDTDRKRTIPGAEERLCRDLRWVGLIWDEGPEIGGPYGPYRQSERTALYREHADRLLRSGHAYRCFCSAERLDALAKQRNQLGLPTDYDRTCLGTPNEESEGRAARGEAHVVRLKVPDQYPEFTDIVYGRVGKHKNAGTLFKHGEQAYEDPVLLKSDGLPTYHLANVVDDHYMDITHVIRAAEWISSTPKHLVMYNAFGWQAPSFAHVGLLQDQDRQKLSKRKFDLSIRTFEEQLGIFPEALVNYVALLGWSHSQRSDFFTLKGLIDNFDMKFTKGNTIVTFGKLWHLQKRFAQSYAEEGGAPFHALIDRLHGLAPKYTKEENLELVLRKRDLRGYIALLVQLDAKNFSTVEDFYQRNTYFFNPVILSRLETSYGHDSSLHGVPVLDLGRAAKMLSQVHFHSWNTTSLHNAISEAVTSYTGVTAGSDGITLEAGARLAQDRYKAFSKALHSYLRWALVGGMPGPGIADTMFILGRSVALERLNNAATSIQQQSLHDIVLDIRQSEATKSR